MNPLSFLLRFLFLSLVIGLGTICHFGWVPVLLLGLLALTPVVPLAPLSLFCLSGSMWFLSHAIYSYRVQISNQLKALES